MTKRTPMTAKRAMPPAPSSREMCSNSKMLLARVREQWAMELREKNKPLVKPRKQLPLEPTLSSEEASVVEGHSALSKPKQLKRMKEST